MKTVQRGTQTWARWLTRVITPKCPRNVRRNRAAGPISARGEPRQLVCRVGGGKRRAVGLQGQTVFQRPDVHRGEPELVDEPHPLADGQPVVAGGADRYAVRCSLWAVALVELVVAELVEALDHACGWEALLHD